MGYSLIIGEKIIETEDDFTSVWAEEARHDNAPAFGEPTDYTNKRWPSYSVWADFCRSTELYDLFYTNKKALLKDHPGWQILTPYHQTAINVAYTNFKCAAPDAKLKMDEDINNGYLCRLEWLKYWVDWALENCENPVFCNS